MSGNTRHRGTRWAAVTSLVAGAVLAAPGVAVAADNLPPLKPAVSDLKSGPDACAAGEDRPYAGEAPILTARLYDPAEDDQPAEGNFLSGDFEAWWTAADGTVERRAYTTSSRLSGSPFEWRLPADYPHGAVVSWRVRANDGEAVSAWSSEAGGSVCEFAYDTESPEPPVITSSDYPDDGGWHDGEGVYGTFHFDSPSDDVVAYRYDVAASWGTVNASEPGGPADFRYLPADDGPKNLEVQAIDRGGRVSSVASYWFYVNTGRPAAARWKLADDAGSRTAAAEAGPPARAGAGVTFGSAVPSGTSLISTASLDGAGHGFLTPDVPVVGAGETFAVGGWVRPSAVDTVRTIASQDAVGAPAFTLGLRQEGGGPVWSFGVNGTLMTGGLPETDEWAYVLGAYDAETGKARLYVNGRSVGEEKAVTPVAAEGNFQIGRSRGPVGYRDRWKGEIGDARVYDRVVVADEIAQLPVRATQSRGLWDLETSVDGWSPELQGREALALAQGASIHRAPPPTCDELDPFCVPDFSEVPLEGEGHLELYGVTGHATTSTPMVDTSDSFTVSVRVRLADEAPDRPMTVISQGGTHGDAFKLRYEPSAGSWQLIMSHADEPGAPETVLSSRVTPDAGAGPGHQVAVVYDDALDQVSLFVDGQKLFDGSAGFHSAWKSAGGLQIGRGHTADGWGEYLHGAVDKVRVLAGALEDRSVAALR